MKRLSLLLLMLAMSAYPSNVLIYNPVNGRSVSYLISVHTPDYADMSNVLINPVLPEGIPLEFTKVTNGVVVAMSAAESNAIVVATIAAADAGVRVAATSPLKDFSGNGLLLRAIMDITKDEFNILRNELSIAKTNLVLFQSRPTMAPRTFAQLQNAITNKIAAHTVDTNTQISLLGPRKRSAVVALRAPKDTKH